MREEGGVFTKEQQTRMHGRRKKKMMKRMVSTKVVSMLVVVLFAISFAGVAVSGEAQKAPETVVMKGTITAINPETAQVTVLAESGELVTLAGLDVDLKDQNTGDQVIVEFDKDKVIKSITRQAPSHPAQ